MSVEGFLAQEKLSIVGLVDYSNFILGCAHSTKNFESENKYAGVISISRAPTSLVAHGVTQFSYCLFGSSKRNRQGFLRFGTDIPHNPHYRTTRILQALDDHEFEYYVNLVGVSLGTRKLDKIRPEMFARSKDLAMPLSMMVHAAYYIVEEAVWLDLQSHRAERMKQPGFSLCVRATKAIKGHLPSLSLHFPEEKAVMVLSPKQLFLIMNDNQGQIACLAMAPGDRTVIGTLQQVDTRFVFDLKNSTLSSNLVSVSEVACGLEFGLWSVRQSDSSAFSDEDLMIQLLRDWSFGRYFQTLSSHDQMYGFFFQLPVLMVCYVESTSSSKRILMRMKKRLQIARGEQRVLFGVR